MKLIKRCIAAGFIVAALLLPVLGTFSSAAVPEEPSPVLIAKEPSKDGKPDKTTTDPVDIGQPGSDFDLEKLGYTWGD